MSDKYILDGRTMKQVDLMTWARWIDSPSRIVGSDHVGDVHVSTVFLGIDHGFGGTPLWFETMVFGGPLDGEQERYTTYDEAEAGHAAMLARVNTAADPIQETPR